MYNNHRELSKLLDLFNNNIRNKLILNLKVKIGKINLNQQLTVKGNNPSLMRVKKRLLVNQLKKLNNNEFN